MVILPGRIDPDDIKPFGTILIEKDIPTGIFASHMRVFESELDWYNGLEDDQVVLADQGLIFPNPEPTPTWTHEPLPKKLNMLDRPIHGHHIPKFIIQLENRNFGNLIIK